VSKELRLNRFVTEQPAYNLLDRRAERELLPMAQTYGIAVIPWSPTAGGFLTGRYRRGEAAPAGSRYDAFWNRATTSVLTDPAFDVLEALEQIAADKGCSVGQLALAWCGQQDAVTSPIIGPRTVEQLTDSLGALAVKLTEEDFDRIDSVAPPGRMTVAFYGHDGFAWTSWGPHRYSW
jgi:aryl-alcohol dehydrogenase-like predicted oxidoreductase